MRRVRLMLEYFHPWTNATGFYLARERGWYREFGIEVEIRVFDPARGDTLEHLLRGDVDLGVFPSNRLLVRRERGEPLLGVAAINHGGLETIQTIRATGITRPRELAGRRVALGPTPRGIAMLKHLVRVDGGDPEAPILIDNHHRELTVDDLAAGAADASFGGYWAWDALFGNLAETERITWRVDDIGAPPYHSYLLGACQDLVESQPQLIADFLAATGRGYHDAAADAPAALAVIERAVPYFPRRLLQRSLALIGASWLHDGEWGVQRSELLAPYAAWLQSHGILRRADVWTDAVTNRYLPGHEARGA